MSEEKSTQKTPVYKKWWFWVIIVVVLIAVGGVGSSKKENAGSDTDVDASSVNVTDGPAGSDTTQSDHTNDTSQKDEGKPSVTTEQKNALKKAQSYATNMHMSKQKVYEQLTSEYGEGFSVSDAQYAIDNLTGIDWNANALAKAKNYYTHMNMSKSKVYSQLTSDYGEKFTPEQAQYAIDHLDD